MDEDIHLQLAADAIGRAKRVDGVMTATSNLPSAPFPRT
jgi:hypothetical protein